MMFSKSCEYAIKAVLHLYIKVGEEKCLGIAQIAEAIDSPEPFTGKILQALVRHDLIRSAKGPGGGFYIEKNSRPIKVMEIVDLIDGHHAFERCGLGLKACNDKRPCPIHKEFKSYAARLKNLLEQKTVQDMAKDITGGKAFLINT